MATLSSSPSRRRGGSLRPSLVLCDGLVSDDVLKLAPPARTFFVGKRAGRKSIEQEPIHRHTPSLSVALARRPSPCMPYRSLFSKKSLA